MSDLSLNWLERMEGMGSGMKPDRGILVVLPGRTAEGDGQGTSVGVVRFIESKRRRRSILRQPSVEEPRDREGDMQAAHRAWDLALGMLGNPNFAYIVLDGLHHAVEQGYVRLADVVEAFQSRPSHQHIVITGRATAADLYSYAVQ